MTTRFEEFYREQYQDDESRRTYLTGRDHVYRAVVRILKRLVFARPLMSAAPLGCWWST